MSDPVYDDTHRTFLQSLMSRGTITYTEARPLIAAIRTAHSGSTISGDDISEEDFEDMLATVSDAITAFDYEIRSTVPQDPQPSTSNGSTGGGAASQSASARRSARAAPASISNSSRGTERVYAVINTASDPATQLATTFTPDELAFVKRVLDQMFERNNTLRREVCAVMGKAALGLHSVKDGGSAAASRRRAAFSQAAAGTSGEANGADGGPDGVENGVGAAQSITMSQAQGVLDALVAQGWFELSRRGFYTLTPRALMELRTWLVEAYNDDDDDEAVDEQDGDGEEEPRRKIKHCAACKEIVTMGQRCPKKTCLVRLHDACTERYFRMEKAERCSACKTSWAGYGFVGERAAEGGAGRRSTGAVPASQRRRQGLDGAADDSDE